MDCALAQTGPNAVPNRNASRDADMMPMVPHHLLRPDQVGSRQPLRLLLALVLSLVCISAVACSGASDAPPDLRAGRAFEAFAVYWLGTHFEHWKLNALSTPATRDGFVSLIYGDCTPHGGDEPSCTPPLEIQISPLCAHLREVARNPLWRHRRVRGAPVGTIDGAPVLFSRGTQVKVYRGENADAGAPLRALRALRSLNRVSPVIRRAGDIPRPPPGVLGRSRPCPR